MNMDKNTFWRIIDEVNSEVPSSDQESVLRVTQEKLLQHSPQEIAVWANHLRYYRDIADTSGVFAASCCLNDYMSDDGFMDFRAWLISRGKEVYMAALKDPDSLGGLDIPEDTRFESYGYVAYDAFKRVCRDDVYKVMDQNPLTETQKAEIRAEIEYCPHQVTSYNAESHLPNLYAKYLKPDQSILLIDYQPRFTPPAEAPVPVTELEKLKSAALLIEDMTGCRFKHSSGGAFIYPDRDEYLAINMRREADYGTRTYHISFDANLQTMGRPMDSVGLARLQQEVGVAHALLSMLEARFNISGKEVRDTVNALGLEAILNIQGAETHEHRYMYVDLSRICQEAATNSIRHGGATQLEVYCRFGTERVSLRLKDNGSSQETYKKGNGLIGMEERVNNLFGDITMDKAKDGGFEIVIEVPVIRDEE